MVRLALVVGFVTMLALLPRISPGTAPSRPAPDPVVVSMPAAEPSAPDIAAEPEIPPAPPVETPSAVLPADTQAQTQTPDAVETPGEQRTSSTARPDERPESIEVKVQKELVRMACFTGRQETGWGRRSRSALRRFTARARPRTGSRVSQELLDIMAAYPAEYCRSCRPGERACDIGAGGRRRSGEAAPPAEEPGAVQVVFSDQTTNDSYLPPWMRGKAETANAAAEPAESARPDRALRKTPRKAQRRKTARRARLYRYAGRQRRLPGFLRSSWFMPN